MKTIEQRLAALEIAQASLAVKHTALAECTAFMFANPGLNKQQCAFAATVLYDMSDNLIENDMTPETYQQVWRQAIDVFFEQVHAYRMVKA